MTISTFLVVTNNSSNIMFVIGKACWFISLSRYMWQVQRLSLFIKHLPFSLFSCSTSLSRSLMSAFFFFFFLVPKKLSSSIAILSSLPSADSSFPLSAGNADSSSSMFRPPLLSFFFFFFFLPNVSKSKSLSKSILSAPSVTAFSLSSLSWVVVGAGAADALPVPSSANAASRSNVVFFFFFFLIKDGSNNYKQN